MRLVYVCSDRGIRPGGTKGASVHLRAITGALAKLGHEVLLLSPREAPGDGHPAQPVLNNGCPLGEEASRRLKAWFEERGLDDAVADELRSLAYNAWVSGPALRALAPDPPDAVLERLSLFGHAGTDVSRALDVPFVVEVNAPLVEEARRFRSLQLSDLAADIERRVLSGADAVLTVSAALADYVGSAGVARGKVHVVPNGVDESMFEGVPSRLACREKLGFQREFVVGFAGSLKYWHGVDVLVSAFARLAVDDASARLLIVGTGPADARLRAQVAERSLQHAVVFTGAVPHDHVPALLGAMDVAVAPFRRLENFYFSPIKLFEYMASGTCVIASRLGQIADVLQDGGSGLLCAPDDEGDLYAALKKAHGSEELRRQLGSEAVRAVRARYTWAHAARATERVLHQATESRRRRAVAAMQG